MQAYSTPPAVHHSADPNHTPHDKLNRVQQRVWQDRQGPCQCDTSVASSNLTCASFASRAAENESLPDGVRLWKVMH